MMTQLHSGDRQAASIEKTVSQNHTPLLSPCASKRSKEPTQHCAPIPPPQHLDSPVQEGIAKGIELSEGFLGIHHQGVAGDDPLYVSLHHRYEGISGRLRPNPHAWEILFQQVPAGKGAVI